MSEAVATCEHIHDNNFRCGSPAMKGFHFCYHHARYHLPPRVRGKRQIRVSALESGHSLQIALSHIAQAILDDEIDSKKAFALIQVMQLGCRVINMNQRVVGRNLIELPASMSHLVEQPQPEPQPDATPASHNSSETASPSDPVTVPKKKPRMTEKEFEPWRKILFEGESHPQYEEACRRYDEFLDGFEKLPQSNSA